MRLIQCPQKANEIMPKAPIYEYFPKMKADCKEFIFSNINNVGVKILRDEMVTNFLSKHMDAFKQDRVAGITTEHSERYNLLERYLSQPSAVTQQPWVGIHALSLLAFLLPGVVCVHILPYCEFHAKTCSFTSLFGINKVCVISHLLACMNCRACMQ